MTYLESSIGIEPKYRLVFQIETSIVQDPNIRHETDYYYNFLLSHSFWHIGIIRYNRKLKIQM